MPRTTPAFVLAFCTASVLAGRYDGYRLVRLWPDTPAEQSTIESLNIELMSEAILRDGGTEYLATDEELARLAQAGVDYQILVKDVQARIDAERARLEARQIWGQGPAPRADNTFFTEFRDINELNTFFDQLVADHPTLISRQTIGTSIQGRTIEAFNIGAPGDLDSRPSIIINGMAHAREWISPMTVAYIMRGLLDGYATDPEINTLLQNVTFRVAPIMNPDGYVYTWTADRFWRKTRRNNGDGTFGVDWNRNWAQGWGGAGSSGSTDSDVYRGTAPFSEPETRALRDYTLSIPNRAFHIDFHSFSQLVLWPWGYTTAEIPEPDRSIEDDIAHAYADVIASTTGAAYAPIKSSDLYVAAGDSTDWHYGGGDVYSLTVELRPSSGGVGGFDPSPTEILPCAQENLAALIDLAQTVAAGVTATFPAGRPAVVPPNQTSQIDIQIFPAFSGPLDANSATLWTRVGDTGPFQSAPMTNAGDTYTGTLPAAPCGSTIDYYVTIDATTGATYTVPLGAPDSPYSADVLELTTAFNDDMETDTGWTVGAPGDSATTGIWERADPQGTAAQPENDHTPTGTQCWVTDGNAGSGLGSFDIDGGVTTLISPVMDASGQGQASVSFWLWYSNDQGAAPGTDTMPIRVSNDGGATWTLLDTISTSTNAWVFKQYELTNPTDQMRFRFEASDLGDGSIVEAAIDDLSIDLVGCSGNPADLAPPFGVLDLADIQAFVNAFIAGDPLADIAPPFGVLDLNDVSLFVTAFLAGP